MKSLAVSKKLELSLRMSTRHGQIVFGTVAIKMEKPTYWIQGMSIADEYIPLLEVYAKRLHVTPQTIRNWIKIGMHNESKGWETRHSLYKHA